jgi:hypothetical protein
MEPGFIFDLLWNDNDVFEVCVRAWNGKFGGTLEVYVPIGGLAEAAEQVEGFPRNTSDERHLQFGRFGPEWAGGAVAMRFYCKSKAGRTCVEVTIESEYQPQPGVSVKEAERAHFVVPVEASGVDTFVAGLRRLEAERHGTAELKAVLLS